MIDILNYSKENNLSHIPSALSQYDYLDELFLSKTVVPFRDKIVIGKPFGAQAYYLIWKKYGFLNSIESLSVGVKHEEIDFVDYGEETMGNALGVAAGIALSTEKRVWANISDATLQMGNTLEAIQFIGHNCLKNILLTVDFNQMQVTGRTDSIISVQPTISFFKEYGWDVKEVDGHDRQKLKLCFESLEYLAPTVVFCHTTKGHGVPEMELNPVEWHYKKL